MSDPDFMKDVFGTLPADKPVPPPKGATIGELVKNMEHNIKVRESK